MRTTLIRDTNIIQDVHKSLKMELVSFQNGNGLKNVIIKLQNIEPKKVKNS